MLYHTWVLHLSWFLFTNTDLIIWFTGRFLITAFTIAGWKSIKSYKNLENIGSVSNESTRQENLRKRMVGLGVTVMLFNATFNIISFISWQSVLLVEEIGVPGKNNRPVTSHWQTLSHYVVSNIWTGFDLTNLVVIGTDCRYSCTSSHHTITATTKILFMFIYIHIVSCRKHNFIWLVKLWYSHYTCNSETK